MKTLRKGTKIRVTGLLAWMNYTGVIKYKHKNYAANPNYASYDYCIELDVGGLIDVMRDEIEIIT